MTPIQLIFWYLNIAATVALLARLAQTGLISTYRWFVFYLLADLSESLLQLYFLRIRAWNHYAETYMAGQAVKMVLTFLVLLELYRLALASRPAIARFGRQTVGIALAAAAAIAALGLIIDRSVPKDQSPILYRYFKVERTMDVWALLFLLLITAFMLWFPVPLMKNAAFYLLGFIVYFSARSAGLLVVNVLPQRFMKAVDPVMLAVSSGCLVFWMAALRRRKEDETTVLGHSWDPAALGRLTGQLDAINANLLRLSRR